MLFLCYFRALDECHWTGGWIERVGGGLSCESIEVGLPLDVHTVKQNDWKRRQQ